nr:cache domain-containing protein [Ralstonia mannitolilytica]
MATLVVAALLGVFALTQRGKFQADIQALLRQHQQALVHEAATDLRERLDEYLGLVQRTAAQAGHVNFASPQEALRYFNSISPVSTLFDGMFIVGLDGRISASFPHVQGVVGLDVHDRDYFKEVVIVGQPTISSPLRNRVGGAPNIVFAAPIFDDAGRITGVFCASLGLLRPNFLGDLRNMRIGANGYVFVVQRGNHPMFVIHPDDNKLLAETTIEPAIANALAEMPTDDTGPLVITENIIATGWTLGSWPLPHRQRRQHRIRE